MGSRPPPPAPAPDSASGPASDQKTTADDKGTDPSALSGTDYNVSAIVFGLGASATTLMPVVLMLKRRHI